MSVSLFDQVVAGKTPSLLPLTVEQFHRMIEAGILRDGEPVELIDGVLVRKDSSALGGNAMGHSARHALVVTRLQRLAERVEPHGCHIRLQLPVTLSNVQEPEPDGSVVRGTPENYADHHPGPAQTLAVIEVADSSLEHDRTTKQRIYASAGIPQYVIVNLPDGQLEVYESPSIAEGRFVRHAIFKPGQSIRLALGSTTLIDVTVTELLP